MLVAALRGDEYVEGVSLVVHKAMDVANCDALVLLVEMEQRIFVTARSRVAALDVSAVLAAVGGGGHAAAASAIVKDVPLAVARRRADRRPRALARGGPDGRGPHVAAGALGDASTRPSTRPAIICEGMAMAACRSPTAIGWSGSVSRRDLDRAVRHKLGHAPVKAVMTTSATRRVGARHDARRGDQRPGPRPGWAGCPSYAAATRGRWR